MKYHSLMLHFIALLVGKILSGSTCPLHSCASDRISLPWLVLPRGPCSPIPVLTMSIPAQRRKHSWLMPIQERID
jgi:hypothetical protein